MSEASERVGPGGDGRRRLLVTKRLTVDSDIDAKLAIGILHDPNLHPELETLQSRWGLYSS